MGYYTDLTFVPKAQEQSVKDWASVKVPDDFDRPIISIELLYNNSQVVRRFCKASVSLQINSIGDTVSLLPGLYNMNEVVSESTMSNSSMEMALYNGRLAVKCLGNLGDALPSIDVSPQCFTNPYCYAAWFGHLLLTERTDVTVAPGEAIYLDTLELVNRLDKLRADSLGQVHTIDQDAEDTYKRYISVGYSNNTIETIDGTIVEILDSTAHWGKRLPASLERAPGVTLDNPNFKLNIAGTANIWIPHTTVVRRDGPLSTMSIYSSSGSFNAIIGIYPIGAEFLPIVPKISIDSLGKWSGKNIQFERPRLLAGKRINVVWVSVKGHPLYELGSSHCTFRLHHR